jgi:hypothetical protein
MAPPSRLHATAFLAWGAVPTCAAALALARGPVRPLELLLAAFALAWWGVGVGLRRGRLGAAPALALVAVPWSLALAQGVRRAAFVAREGRLEGADGHGSPMAFVLGLAMEQLLVFLPLTAVGVLLWRAARRERARPAA